MLSPKVTERLLQICGDLSVSASPSHLPFQGRPIRLPYILALIAEIRISPATTRSSAAKPDSKLSEYRT